MTFVLNCDRNFLLRLLPRHQNVAEIGVKRGKFAHEIIRSNLPCKLHLIDPWGKDEDDEYLAVANETQENTNEIYQRVVSEFSKHTRSGLVKLHRDYSYRVAEQFDDGYFGWVYIDAIHTYEPALMDLRCFDKKVSDDGLIVGHDFARSVKSTRNKYGVVEAVEKFLEENEAYKLIAITNEPFCSFVIAKNPESENTKLFLNNMFTRVDFMVEITDFFASKYFQVEHEYELRKLKNGVKLSDQTRIVARFS